MAFTEDLSVFLDLDGFGVPVTAGAVSGVGILDKSVEVFFGGDSKIIDYMLTAATAQFGNLAYGQAMTVDGVNFKVLEKPDPFDEDGALCRIPLIKITADEVPGG